MSHQFEKPAPVGGTGLSHTFGVTTEHPKDTPTPRKRETKPTDRERILAALRKGWVCAISFNNGSFDRGKPILRYTARFHDLRREGWYIERRKCEDIWHTHDAPIYEWRIPPVDPEQPSLFGEAS